MLASCVRALQRGAAAGKSAWTGQSRRRACCSCCLMRVSSATALAGGRPPAPEQAAQPNGMQHLQPGQHPGWSQAGAAGGAAQKQRKKAFTELERSLQVGNGLSRIFASLQDAMSQLVFSLALLGAWKRCTTILWPSPNSFGWILEDFRFECIWVGYKLQI